MIEVTKIETEIVRNKVSFAAGPRIEKVETIHLADGSTVRVEYWYDNGRLCFIK